MVFRRINNADMDTKPFLKSLESTIELIVEQDVDAELSYAGSFY